MEHQDLSSPLRVGNYMRTKQITKEHTDVVMETRGKGHTEKGVVKKTK